MIITLHLKICYNLQFTFRTKDKVLLFCPGLKRDYCLQASCYKTLIPWKITSGSLWENLWCCRRNRARVCRRVEYW